MNIYFTGSQKNVRLRHCFSSVPVVCDWLAGTKKHLLHSQKPKFLPPVTTSRCPVLVNYVQAVPWKSLPINWYKKLMIGSDHHFSIFHNCRKGFIFKPRASQVLVGTKRNETSIWHMLRGIIGQKYKKFKSIMTVLSGSNQVLSGSL